MRKVGDQASACPKCGGPRIWKMATADRWRQYCSPCHSATSYASRKRTDPEHLAKVQSGQREKPRNRAYSLWRGAKKRADAKGLAFNITREEVEAWLNVGVCQITGLPFDLRLGTKRQEPLAPSLDRINPKLGYVAGNVQCVCWLYNRAKGDGTHDELMILATALFTKATGYAQAT